MSSKRFFLYFIGLAIVPLMLAYAVLKLGWFTPGGTAKGQFVETEIQLNLKLTDPSTRPMWNIVVQPNNNCLSTCEELLYGLNQTYVALGKLQKRVQVKVLTTELDLTNYPHLSAASFGNQLLEQNQFYVVDPFGKVILQYPASDSREQTIKSSKAILADIKKLLNYSRVS